MLLQVLQKENAYLLQIWVKIYYIHQAYNTHISGLYRQNTHPQLTNFKETQVPTMSKIMLLTCVMRTQANH